MFVFIDYFFIFDIIQKTWDKSDFCVVYNSIPTYFQLKSGTRKPTKIIFPKTNRRILLNNSQKQLCTKYILYFVYFICIFLLFTFKEVPSRFIWLIRKFNSAKVSVFLIIFEYGFTRRLRVPQWHLSNDKRRNFLRYKAKLCRRTHRRIQSKKFI